MVGSRWLVFLFAFALLPFAPLSPTAAPAHADPPVFDGKEVKDLCTISVSGRSCPVLPPPAGLPTPARSRRPGPGAPPPCAGWRVSARPRRLLAYAQAVYRRMGGTGTL